MAYYEMGSKETDQSKRQSDFENAQKWLTRASAANKTQTASQYQLGQIAYETQHYTEALKYFKKILKKDPKNVMALKASAYTMIMMGKIDDGKKRYQEVNALEPESVDSGYNYALVLYFCKDYQGAYDVLNKFSATLASNKDGSLLLARIDKALDKPEAIDAYNNWLASFKDDAEAPEVSYEYGELLEKDELYAKAIDNYKTAYSKLTKDSKPANKADVSFALGRAMLLADPTSDDGLKQLQTAVKTDGFSDTDQLDALAKDDRIGKAHQSAVQALSDVITTAAQQSTDEKAAAGKEGTGSSTEKKSGSSASASTSTNSNPSSSSGNAETTKPSS
jgi:tetratricopeptide (TPR) repeat protein